MGGSIPGLSSLGNILSGIGNATGGGGGGGGAAGGTNPNNPNQPNQQQYNFLTDPAVLAQFSMDQGQNPRNVEPPIPPQPTFADTNFFSPQQTMPYSGQKPPQQPQQTPGPQWNPNYGGGQETQATPAPAPIEIPSEQPQQPQGPAGYYGGGQQTQETPAPTPTSIAPPTAPVGNAPTTGDTGGGGGGGGQNIARTGADIARRIGRATAGTQQPNYYPDIAGSARESGAAAPNAFTPQAGGQAFNPLQAISNLLNQAFGGGLQAMTQQAGPAYGTNPPPTPPQAQATPSAPANAPATAAAQAADAMAPGSAAAAVVAGARGAAEKPATVPQGAGRPPLVLRDPSDPSKGYMPDPNYAKPGSTGENQSHTGGPPGDQPAPGNANQSQNYIQEHGGYSQSGYGHHRGNYGNVALNPEFSNRLTNAGKAYEQETGRQPQYGLGDRDIATQQFYWDDSHHGRRYAAASPGHSLHQRGLAMDMPPNSGFTQWLLANNGANAHRFGLSNPVPHDTFHVQMQDLRGRAYPYATAPVEANFHAAGGQQAATEPAGQGVIPGSQQPAGTRGADVNYQPRDYQRALFQIEGGGNINAPRTGSNRGIAQFGREEERRFGITNRRDINQEARGVQREATENTQHLQQAGVAADPANLYLLHQQGQAGGTALLQADANTPAYQVLRRFYGSDALAQRAIHGNIPSDNPLHNTPTEQITAGQFRDMWRTRFNEQMGNQSQAESGTQLAGDVVPYARPQNYPVIRPSPFNVLSPEQRLQYPAFGTPSGGIRVMPPSPANQAQTRMPIQLAGDINPDIANMVEQRNQELESDRRRNAILAGRPTIEEGSNRGGSHLPNRRFHPSDIDEFIQKNMGTAIGMTPIGRWLGALRSAVHPTAVGRDEDVR